ncbi:MAG: phosphopentomutase [Kiritimatiellia bacterium]
MKTYLIVLDSVGIGAAPDADDYGDAGASSLAHTAQRAGGLNVPTLQSLGLGNIPPLTDGKAVAGVPLNPAPRAAYGALRERSVGKDTTTGHWEIAGLELTKGLALFPPEFPSFPPDLIAAIEQHTGRKIIGNKAASGTAIIDELGAEHMRTGAWIAYTSADSVVQIAAHEEIIPLDELYAACAFIRTACYPLSVGRVIARPFLGSPGEFERTNNRRDFSLPLPENTIITHLADHGKHVVLVGKLDDIFPETGFHESFHGENNPDAMDAVMQLAKRPSLTKDEFYFINFIDFDMRFGHRRDPAGYAAALENTDTFLAELLPLLGPDDCLLITADHGNDPTHAGSDHTREYVPLLVYGKNLRPTPLGVRNGFYDIAQSLAAFFGTPPMRRGTDFLTALRIAPSP